VGRERSRTRLYVYHGLACIIMLAGSACAQLRTVFPGQERPAHLQQVQERINNGDFDAAMRYYQNDLARPAGNGERQADEALFNLGLLYVHYANPKKDYQKALGYFTRLVKEYPRSPLAEEAKIWTSVLESMEKSKRVDIEIEEMKKLTK
jgi:outer membrane protein assembly factor BamD (BamD/ComL family)